MRINAALFLVLVTMLPEKIVISQHWGSCYSSCTAIDSGVGQLGISTGKLAMDSSLVNKATESLYSRESETRY